MFGGGKQSSLPWGQCEPSSPVKEMNSGGCELVKCLWIRALAGGKDHLWLTSCPYWLRLGCSQKFCCLERCYWFLASNSCRDRRSTQFVILPPVRFPWLEVWWLAILTSDYLFFQIRFGMLVPLLQLRPGEEVQARDLQGLPDRDVEGLRDRSALCDGEVLGVHEILQVRWDGLNYEQDIRLTN